MQQGPNALVILVPLVGGGQDLQDERCGGPLHLGVVHSHPQVRFRDTAHRMDLRAWSAQHSGKGHDGSPHSPNPGNVYRYAPVP